MSLVVGNDLRRGVLATGTRNKGCRGLLGTISIIGPLGAATAPQQEHVGVGGITLQ